MTMQADGSFAASYAFDPVGNLQAGQFGNGVTNWYQYDRLNRLTNSVWNFGAVQRASFTYQLGLTGNRTNLVESITNSASRTYAWKYDRLYRLTNESMTSFGDTSYGLDAVGNRLGMTNGVSFTNSTYNTNDWVTTDAYDNNGNTLASTNSGVTTGPYSYDAENHLTNYNGTVSILYNGDGVRMMKTVAGVNTYYLVDDRNLTGYPQVVEEWNGTDQFGSVTRVYNYGLNLVSQRDIASGTVHYYGTDGHGSVRFLTDTNGTVTDTYQYDAYGNLVKSTGSTVNLYLYCSEQWDPDLGPGMYYLRARYYQPATGRFWTGDTYEGMPFDPLSLHKYLYVTDNPVNCIDPSGHLIIDVGGVYGKKVHRMIGLDFESTAPYGTTRIFGPATSTILGVKWSPSLTASIPDLTQMPHAGSSGEVFEIKPSGGYLEGRTQLQYYLGIFNALDPQKRSWVAGSPTTYTTMPSVIYLGNGVYATVYPPQNGVILYDLDDGRIEVPLLAVLAGLRIEFGAASTVTYSVGNVATAVTADVEATTGVATMDSSMGAP